MLDADLVLKRKADTRFRVVGEEAVVVRQDAAEVIALNEVGARVLELIDEGIDFGHVIDALLEEYDIGRRELAEDVERFVLEMDDAGIIESVSRRA